MGFARALRRLMDERGLSGKALARQVPCDAAYISRLASGKQHPSANIARRLDVLLEATGELADLARREPRLPVPGVAALQRGNRVTQALDVMGRDGIAGIAASLGELVDHYAQTICALLPAGIYDELVTVRSYVSDVIDREQSAPHRTDISFSAGWLSVLLAIAACDMGEHAAARIWCSDAERHSEEAGHPDLAGWAILTRSMIAFYQGRPRQAVMLAERGQRVTQVDTVVHGRLAAQEMRAAARMGDADRMARTRRHATDIIANLPPDTKQSGAFSITIGEDPPYTATSLLFMGRFREAVHATNTVIRTAYHSESQQRGEHPSGYARSLLVLALAHAGTGELDEAVAAGHAALSGSRPSWPTTVLAGNLDHMLARGFSGSRQAAEYHARYLETARRPPGHHLQVPAPSRNSNG